MNNTFFMILFLVVPNAIFALHYWMVPSGRPLFSWLAAAAGCVAWFIIAKLKERQS